MTDLPQLQEALVVAARRRARRARAGSALVGLGALAAVVVALATALDTGEPEREVVATPVPYSQLTAREVANRFGVLRDDSRIIDPTPGCNLNPGPGSRSYLVRRVDGFRICATVGQRSICIVASSSDGFGGGCLGPASDGNEELAEFARGRVDVHKPRRDRSLIYAIVPDGTRDARVTYRDGTVEPVPIEDNFLGFNARKTVDEVSWTTPEGERFISRP